MDNAEAMKPGNDIDPRPRHRRWQLGLWGAAGLVWLAPAMAMLFTDQVAWGPLDFAVFGALLLGGGITYQLAARRRGDTAYRAALAVALATVFVLTWANLAVGVIGAAGNEANAIVWVVLAVAGLGAVLARFRAPRMALALAATALAQASVAGIVPVAGWGNVGEAVAINGAFALSWLLSAWLFRKAARAPEPLAPASGGPAGAHTRSE